MNYIIVSLLRDFGIYILNSFDTKQHLGYLTNKVGRLMGKEMQPNLLSLGYSFPNVYLGVLADLWKRDGITQKELGMSLIKTKSSINKMLNALEKEGLLYREIDQSDSRQKLIYLTQKGKDLRNSITLFSKKLEQELLQNVTEEDLMITKSVLHTLYLKLSEKRYNKTK